MGPLNRITKRLAGLSANTLVLPPLLLGAWAAIYFVETYNFISAPGLGANFEYESAKGKVKVRAKSYSFDAKAQRLEALGLRIEDPAGKIIASARRVVVLRETTGNVHVEAFGVLGDITRFKDGSFSFDSILPKPTEEKGPENAVTVVVHEANLKYTDESRSKVLRMNISVDELEALGAGNNWLAKGKVSIPGSGTFPARFLVADDQSAQADLFLKNTTIDPILPLIERYLPNGETLPFSGKGIKVSGKLQVDAAARLSPKFYGSIGLVANQLVSNEITAQSVRSNLNLYGQRAVFRGDAMLNRAKVQVEQGSLDWTKQMRVVAQLKSEFGSLNDLPEIAKRRIPKEVKGNRFSARALVGYDPKSWSIDGNLSATDIGYGTTAITNPLVKFAGGANGVSATLIKGKLNNSAVTAAVQFEPRTQKYRGLANLKKVNLQQFARNTRLPLSGSGDVQLIFEGSPKSTQLWAGSNGEARYKLDSGKTISGKYIARLQGTPNQLDLNRLVISSPNGEIAAKGKISLNKQSLDLTVIGTGINIAAFAPDIEGKGYLSGELKGKFTDPTFESNVELINIQSGETALPWVRFVASGNQHRIAFEGLSAQYGFTQFTGKGTYDPKSSRIAGTFEAPAIQIAEFSQGQAAGLVKLSEGKFSGTLKSPSATAKLTGGPLAFYGASLQGLSADLSFQKDTLSIQGGRVTVADGDQEGALSLNGKYSLVNRDGNLSAWWKDIPIRPIAQFDDRFAFKGQSSGESKLTIQNGNVAFGNVKTGFKDLFVNGQATGSGSFEANVNNGEWLASGSVGSIERFLMLNQVQVDKNANIKGNLVAFNIDGRNLLQLAKPLWEDADPDAKRILNDLSGNFSGGGTFEWKNDDLGIAFNEVTLSEIQLGTRAAGQIQGDFSRSDKAWQIANLAWKTDEQIVKGGAKIADNGQLTASLEASNFDLNWLNAINSKVPPIAAKLDTSIEIGGSIESPTGRGSAKITSILKGTDTAEPPTLDLFDVSLEKDAFSVEGRFQARGFTGQIRGSGPVEALSTQEKANSNNSLRLQANLDARPVADFKDLLGAIDLEKSRGVVGGGLTLQGTLSDYTLDGGVTFGGTPTESAKIAFRNAATEILDPSFSLNASKDTISITGRATSSRGGDVSLTASTPFRLPEDNASSDWYKNLPILGSIRINNFRVSEGEAIKNNLIESTIASQNLEIRGSIGEPEISGDLAVAGTQFDIPEFKSNGDPFSPPVNPKFALSLTSVDPLIIRTGTAMIAANGSGRLDGTLMTPIATGTLTVKNGVLKLPNARINLEEGGSIGVNYRGMSNGESDMSVPVSISGRTNVTARRGTQSYERYDVTIYVTGDLLKTGDLNLIGQSDPPDLSSAEILALLGQKDLLEALATGARDTRSSEFRDALIGLVVPSLTDQFTSSLAQAFKLDYFAVEYNPFEGVVVSGAKSINRFLTLQGRRQVTAKNAFEKTKYELKLVYRIPSKNVLLSRARFGLSTDQDRPWRITIEYSFRP